MLKGTIAVPGGYGAELGLGRITVSQGTKQAAPISLSSAAGHHLHRDVQEHDYNGIVDRNTPGEPTVRVPTNACCPRRSPIHRCARPA
jgi:hypothetical protein